jgi:hypothetical protein
MGKTKGLIHTKKSPPVTAGSKFREEALSMQRDRESRRFGGVRDRS